MFDLSDVIFNNVDDVIQPLLQKLKARKGWNAQVRTDLDKLEAKLTKKNYITFTGRPNRYHLSRLGDSCLYDVPTYRKGALMLFRGKRVRIVCVGSGRFDRTLMAGVVGKTPVDKIKIKENPTYVFPEIGDHEFAYKGSRFILIKAKGTTPINLYPGSTETIDLNAWDLILLDGSLAAPIGTLKYEGLDKLTGMLIGWRYPDTYASISEALKDLMRKHRTLGVRLFYNRIKT
jgi:hypothetical protein